jgi:hypothetical protein
MINLRELPLMVLMVFTLIYATIGDPENDWWSGSYFIANYLTLLTLFKSHKSKPIRKIGISLSVSILIFIVLKYFVKFNCERYYTIVPFLICLIGLIYIEKHESHSRKDF